MKKLKQLVLLFLVASVTLVSCNKDDDGDSASIEGSWEFSKVGTILSGQEFLVDYDHTTGCNKDYTEIIAGGTLKDHYFEDFGSGCEEDIDNGSWSRSGNTITVNFSGDVTTAEILELSNTTLKLKFTDPDTAEVYFSVLTRK